MKKKKSVFAALLLGTVLAVTGCAGTSSGGVPAADNAGASVSGSEAGAAASSGVASADLKSVRIAASSATAQLSDNALIAQNLGYIDEELAAVGYKAEYIGFAGAGPAINEAFAAKEIDYSFYADFPVITANSNGVKIKVIGTANQEMNYALLVTEKSGIESGADIAGKKIIVTPGTILYKYFNDLCGKYGIDPDSVETVNALSDAQTVLASGEADGLITSLSGATLYAGLGLGTVVEDTTGDLNYASGFVLAGRADFVDENPDVNKALLRALKRAYEYAAANPEEAYKLLKTESSTDESLRQAYGYDESFSYYNPALSGEYLARAQSVYEFAKDNDLLGSEEVDLNEIFDSTYVDEVLAEE